jgi:hypothetical protein
MTTEDSVREISTVGLFSISLGFLSFIFITCRVLQRNRTSTHTHEKIYYKDLAPVIRRLTYPQVQLTSWRPRRAEGVAPVQRPVSLRPQKSMFLF